MARIFVSYRMEGVDAEVATWFAERLAAAGHEVFLASNSIHIGDNWRDAIEQHLLRCDYFLVLLSERSALSEMVIAEVRRARQRWAKDGAPVMLPVRVQHPLAKGLPYDLEAYLEQIQQRAWTTPADSEKIASEILAVIEGKMSPTADNGGPNPRRPSDDERPLPIADPEPIGGILGAKAAFYLERDGLDGDIKSRVAQDPRQLIKLKGPEQIGKSSLLSRIAADARARNFATASISFQLAVDGQLESAESGLIWFCSKLTRSLGKPQQFFKQNWPTDAGGATTAALEYIAESLLPQLNSKVVVCLDNLDHSFEHLAFCRSFLPLVRELYDQGADNSELAKLRIVIAYSTECSVKLPANQSPFENVGYTRVAPAFTDREIHDLCRRHRLELSAPIRLQLFEFLAGHPYLTRLALHEAASKTTVSVPPDVALQTALHEGATDAGIFGDHLRKKLVSIANAHDARIASSMKEAVRGARPVAVDVDVAERLLGAGVVVRIGNEVTPSSKLYREYFRAKL